MGRLSAETEERMINIENNIVVVMLEKERGRGERRGKVHLPKIIWAQSELCAAFKYLIFPTETKPPEIKDCSCVPSSLYPRVAGVNTHCLGKGRASKEARFKTGQIEANKPEAGPTFYKVIWHAGCKRERWAGLKSDKESLWSALGRKIHGQWGGAEENEL